MAGHEKTKGGRSVYYSAIGILAILVMLIESHDVLLNPKDALKRPAWKVYRRFLFAVLAYYITDVLWGFLEGAGLAVLLFADTTVYFFAMAVGVLFWAEFIVAYLEEESAFGRFLVTAGRAIAAVTAVLSVVNIFTPLLFTVDSDAVYTPLTLRYAVLTSQILLLLLISAYAVSSILRHPEEKNLKFRTLVYFGSVTSVFLALQLWFPFYPLYSIAYMISTSMIHTFVISEEKEEYRRDLAEAEKIAELKDVISSMLDNIPGMTFTKDAETGVYLACNQSFAAYAQKDDPEDVIGYVDAELFDAETAKNFGADDRMALSMDEPYIFFENIPDDEGGQRQMQTTKLKYTDGNGRLCLLGIIQDVTDMVRIQRESATSVEAYEKARGAGIMYSHMAQSMARGFMALYYVNIDSEEFIEYHPDAEGRLAEARRGWHFFEECERIAEERVYQDDRASVLKTLDRKSLEEALDRNKTVVSTFRRIAEDGMAFVSMKISRMEDDGRYIIIGITDVDEHVKERQNAVRLREEQIAYARLVALAGDFLSIFLVDPETGRFREIRTAAGFESLMQTGEQEDFFTSARDASARIVHPEDMNRYLSLMTRENILSEIGERGFFTLTYRIMTEDEPRYVQFKAAMTEEPEGRRLIVGISDIDAQVRQEERYIQSLAQAQIEAHLDPLTGVKNRHAYLDAEERMNRQLMGGYVQDFAIVIFDVNDLKKVNDVEGHQAGDRFLQDACRIICGVFDHSPVFRIGGDEFAVIAQGGDYARIDELMAKMDENNENAIKNGGIVIACGMAKREGESTVAPVFVRADQQMYDNKSDLKARREEMQ
jgi:diguanylate cyclase (GGDEF)-like protein